MSTSPAVIEIQYQVTKTDRLEKGTGGMVITEIWLRSVAPYHNAWSREQMNLLGVPKGPALAGWKQRLIGTTIPDSNAQMLALIAERINGDTAAFVAIPTITEPDHSMGYLDIES